MQPIDYFKPGFDDLKRMDKLTENLDLTLNKNSIKSITEVDLLFMPIISSDHIYSICFNMKKPKIEILDNSKSGTINKYDNAIWPLVIFLLYITLLLVNYVMVMLFKQTCKC